jgi:hypothetical protein
MENRGQEKDIPLEATERNEQGGSKKQNGTVGHPCIDEETGHGHE